MKPGGHLESVSDESTVLRFVISQYPENVIDATAFEMSSEEKNQEISRLSVWEKSLTPLHQARQFVNNPKRDLVVEMKVGEIRALVDDVTNEHLSLDVKWDYLDDCLDKFNKQRLPNARLGCDGHCGLFGINQRDKVFRKRIRARLVELANWSVRYKV
jgi:hypothetical protein